MGTVDLTIRNAKIVTPEWIFAGGLAIDEGKVIMITKDTLLPNSDRTIDAKGNPVLPGIIDPHFHPGSKAGYIQDITTETLSAAAGGVTTAGSTTSSTRMINALKRQREINSPDDVPSFKEVFPQLREEVENNSMIDIFLSFAITNDKQACEIPEYAYESGVTSFKFYLGYKGGDKITSKVGLGKFAQTLGFPHGFDDGTVYLGFENISRLGPPAIAMIHAENMEVARIFFAKVLKEGRKDLAAWADRSPPLCEAMHIRAYAYFAKVTGCPLYVVHLSSRLGLEEVIRAKMEGINIIAETCPQYLIITKHDDPPGVYGKVNPSIKDYEDNERLWEGIRNGNIQCMGTDHVPATKEQRQGWDQLIGDVPPKHVGFVGMETLLPALLSEGVNKGRLNLQRLVEVCCRNNAKTFGLYPRKGCLEPGSDADITIVDLDKTIKVSLDTLHSDSNPVFEGRELKGWPIMTILRGQIIYDRESDSFPEKLSGRYLPRGLEV